jgi:hypothetical protein
VGRRGFYSRRSLVWARPFVEGECLAATPGSRYDCFMCGRFEISALDQILATFDADEAVEVSPRYNIAPSQQVPIVRAGGWSSPRLTTPGKKSAAPRVQSPSLGAPRCYRCSHAALLPHPQRSQVLAMALPAPPERRTSAGAGISIHVIRHVLPCTRLDPVDRRNATGARCERAFSTLLSFSRFAE